jgi:hypothetical protein
MPFPVSPDNGEQYTIGNVTWEYISSSNSWNLIDWQNFNGVSVEVFTGSGTWTKPSQAKIVHVTAIGTGISMGGGALTSAFFDASLLGSTVSVTVASDSSSIFGTLKAGSSTNLDGGYGKYNGGGGGQDGYTDGYGGFFDGNSGATSYGGAPGQDGSTYHYQQGDIEVFAYGGGGGESPLYSTIGGSLGNNLPIPGGRTASGAGGQIYGAGGGGLGVVVVKVWYG